jgi:tripeptidyl-peptidase-1
VPLAQANTLLGASYQLYRHLETNETILRTIGYALPAALHDRVQTVAPTTYFGSLRALRQTSRLDPNGPTLPNGDLHLQNAATLSASGSPVPPICSNITTPACLRRLYNTEGYKPQATAVNKLGIAGYLQEFASHSDLRVFMTRFRRDAENATFSVVTINGGINDENNPGGEVRPVFPARIYVFLISRRLTLTYNTPRRSPTRPHMSTTAQEVPLPSSLMNQRPRIRTSHIWTGSISSFNSP